MERPSIVKARAPKRGSRTARRKVMSTAELAEKVAQLVNEGYSSPLISQRLGYSPRTIEKIRQRNRENGGLPVESFIHLKAPVTREELAADLRWCLRDTPEGFRRFFDRFSGLTLAPHSFKFVQAAYYYCGDHRPRKLGWEGTSPGDCPKCHWKLRVLILVPPDHAKTAIFSTWMRLWRVCQNRDFRSIIISETGEHATQIAREIALELEENVDLLEAFGRFRSDKANSWWQPGKGALKVEGATFKRGFNVFARGAGAQIQGFRTDELVIDDLIGPEDVLTEERRRQTSWWLKTVVVSRVDPGTRICIVATKQHLYDIYEELEGQRKADGSPAWEVIKFPALRDPDTGDPSMGDDAVPLWPELRPRSFFVDEILPYVTSAAFAMAWQQDPLPESERIFRHEYIHGQDHDPNPNRGCLDRERAWGNQLQEPGWVRCIAIDPSPSNYWAIVVADVKVQRDEFNVRILEIVREKLTVPRFLMHMERLVVAYSPRYIIPEKNSANLFILQSADWTSFENRHRGQFRVIPHETQRNKQDPEYGLESMALDVELGRVRIPYAHDPETRGQAIFLVREMLDFPHGKSDDVLMALWFLKANLKELFLPRNSGPRRPNSGWKAPKWVKGRKGVMVA